jgi:hypothetical protein
MQREADNGADCKPQKHRDQKADAVTCDGLTGRGLLDRPVDRIECSVEREQHDEQERDESREVGARAYNDAVCLYERAPRRAAWKRVQQAPTAPGKWPEILALTVQGQTCWRGSRSAVAPNAKTPPSGGPGGVFLVRELRMPNSCRGL